MYLLGRKALVQSHEQVARINLFCERKIATIDLLACAATHVGGTVNTVLVTYVFWDLNQSSFVRPFSLLASSCSMHFFLAFGRMIWNDLLKIKTLLDQSNIYEMTFLIHPRAGTTKNFSKEKKSDMSMQRLDAAIVSDSSHIMLCREVEQIAGGVKKVETP